MADPDPKTFQFDPTKWGIYSNTEDDFADNFGLWNNKTSSLTPVQAAFPQKAGGSTNWVGPGSIDPSTNVYKSSVLGSAIGDTNPLTGKKIGGWAFDIGNLATGALNAYGKYKQAGVAEDTLNFQKNLANANLTNAADLTQADFNWREKARKDYDAKYVKQNVNLQRTI